MNTDSQPVFVHPEVSRSGHSGMATYKITMKDVARHAGVHQASVSVVLNGSRSSAGVSADARERILAAASELGYRRNGSAGAMRTGRFGTLALLLSSEGGNSYLPSQLMSGLQRALAPEDLSLLVCCLPDEELDETGALPKILREQMCDGLLIDYNKRIPASMEETIERHCIPAVWINTRRDSDCVFPDDFEAGAHAARLLLQQGHRRIAYIDFVSPHPDDPSQHYSRRDRRDGFLNAMREAGLPALAWDERPCRADPVAWCRDQLGKADRPTAAVGYATWAMEPLLLASASLRFSLPCDLSLVTFGPEQSHWMCQTMTMLIEPHAEIARTATELLLAKIERPDHKLAPRSAQFGLEHGNSVEKPFSQR